MTALSPRRFINLIGATLVLVGLVSGPAHAEFGVRPDPLDPSRADFHADVIASDGATPYTQAGGHDFSARTSFTMNTSPDGSTSDGHLRDVRVDLPAGFVGNPTAVPQCSFAAMLKGTAVGGGRLPCPSETQVGVTVTHGGIGFGVPLTTVSGGVFNMKPLPGDAATFAFVIQGAVVAIHAHVRNESDYGVYAEIPNVNATLPIVDTSLTLWGVPAAAEHDAERGDCLTLGGSCTANIPELPFLTNPADCTAGPATTKLTIDSWQNPGTFLSYEATSPPVDGCERLEFKPSVRFRPTVAKAGAPSGYTVTLKVPQNEDPHGLATPPVRDVTMTLPDGVSLSPSAANGLQWCSDAAFARLSADEGSCPPASKVGTVDIITPLLADHLTGSVYIGQPVPGQMFRIFLEAAGAGVRVKLEGRVDLDPVTGQVTTTFSNTPQVPFSELVLKLKGGDRAALLNPPTCGTYITTARLTPYSAPFTPIANVSDSFEVSHDGAGAPCPPRGFAPKVTGGSVSPVAGDDTTFTLTATREDADQDLLAMNVDLPRGLLAHVADVPLCPAAQAAAGTCDASSRIGTVTTGAGAGPSPFYVSGGVFLTEPYKDAPFGLSIVVPAVAGPFDLGTVVVRAALQVDRSTAALRTVVDPLPTILQGVPLHVKVVNVTIDRPHFMLNPTSCAAKKLTARFTSVEGATATATTPFQLTNCAALRFHPRMTIGVGRKGHTGARSSTPLTTTLRMPKGGANLRSVHLVLPDALNARLDVINDACELATFQAGKCDSSSQAGTAVARTPLLKHALRGPVLFVKNPARPLPDIVVALRGEVDFDLVGKVSIPGGVRLATTFDAPDVPVSSFKLSLVDGKNGPLGVAENLCSRHSRSERVTVRYVAQTGKVLTSRPRLNVKGCARRGKR